MSENSIWLLSGAAAVLLALLVLQRTARAFTQRPRTADVPSTALPDLYCAPGSTPLPPGVQKALGEELAGARQVGVDDVASSFCIVGYARNGDCVGVLTYPDRIHRRYVQEVHSGDTVIYTRTLDA